MRLLGKKRASPEAQTQHRSRAPGALATPRLPGYVAFAPEDVGDAKRLRPEFDLRTYASERGLDALGSGNAAGFFAALPLDEQLQYNVVRGKLAGGASGIMFHQVMPLPVDADGTMGSNGVFYGLVYSRPEPFRLRELVIPHTPLIFDWHDGNSVDPLAQCVGAPCTVASILVPEATALGDFQIDNRPKPWKVPGHREKLQERGLPGWQLMSRGSPPDARAVDRMLSETSLAALRELGARPYAMVDVRYGTLIVRVNGYLRDPASLDGLSRAACTLADELREAGLRVNERQPFATALPTVDWPEQGYSLSGRFPPDPWLIPLHAYERKHRLTLEDPVAYHCAFPSLPVPGRAFAVMRGKLAAGIEGRVAWHAERSIAADNQGRNAVLLPARRGAGQTPRGGVRIAERQLNYAVCGDTVAVWERRSKAQRGDLGEMAGLVTRALELARELDVLNAGELL